MGIRKKIEDIFSAVAFAEAGEHETAKQMMEDGDGKGGRPQGYPAKKASLSPSLTPRTRFAAEED